MLDINRKEDCCGCRACEQICPKKCINIYEDNEGFQYPNIDKEKCINCNLCDKVCPIIYSRDYGAGKSLSDNTQSVFAAYNKNNKIIKESSSGGIFSILAEYILGLKGIVCGCSFNNDLVAEHIIISEVDDLSKLRGSKYVQSDTKDVYSIVKRYLDDSIDVMFVGTPCQVAGINQFLKLTKTNTSKLITLDLICHGVPSIKMFKKYIDSIEMKKKYKITEFKFRDKTKGEWGLVFSYKFIKNNRYGKKVLGANLSPYYYGFLNNMLFRPICYECPYSSTEREGDITLGDYWGVEKFHPEIDASNGVSAVIINSDKGRKLFKQISDKVFYIDSNVENIKLQNSNLYKPSLKHKFRNSIYVDSDKLSFDELSKKYLKPKGYIWVIIKNMIPPSIKIKLKRLIKL